MIEDFAIATAAYGQQLFGLLSEKPVDGGQLLLAGGVDYDRASSSDKPAKQSDQPAPERLVDAARGDGNRTAWRFLPGTANEASASPSRLSPKMRIAIDALIPLCSITTRPSIGCSGDAGVTPGRVAMALI